MTLLPELTASLNEDEVKNLERQAANRQYFMEQSIQINMQPEKGSPGDQLRNKYDNE